MSLENDFNNFRLLKINRFTFYSDYSNKKCNYSTLEYHGMNAHINAI